MAALAVCLLVGYPLQAKGEMQTALRCVEEGISSYKINSEQFSVTESGMILPKHTNKEVGATEHMVTFVPKYDMEMYLPKTLVIFNKDTYVMSNDLMYGMQEETSISLPEGTYDCWLAFNDMTLTQNYINVKEQIEIRKDTTITFDVSDVTERVKFRQLSPEGKEWTLDVKGYDSDVEEYGNAKRLMTCTNLVLRDYGYVVGALMNLYYRPVGASGFYDMADLYMTPLSDRYMYVNSTIAIDKEDNCYVTKMTALPSQVKENISNNPSAYIPLQTDFYLDNPGQSDEYFSGFNSYDIYNGEWLGGWTGEMLGLKAQKGKSAMFYIDAPASDSSAADRFDVLISPSQYVVETNDKGKMAAFPVVASPIAMKDGKPCYTGVLTDTYYTNQYEHSSDNLLGMYPGMEALEYEDVNRAVAFGETAPYAVFAMYDYDSAFYWALQYFGLLGEKNNTCERDLKFSMNYCGKPVEVKDFDEFMQLPYSIDIEYGEKGKLEMNMETGSHTINGVEVSNNCYVETDFNRQDFGIPTLRRLQLSDKDNKVTNAFKSNEAINLGMVVADYDFVWNKFKKVYISDLGLCQVDLKYSKHGTEEWNPLTPVVNQELSSTDHGWFYETDFVVDADKDSWYDLLIEVKDQEGNLQRQLISPAFKVMTGSAVDNIEPSQVKTVDAYSIQGNRIASNVKYDSLELEKGIYIIVDKSTGQVVKKIVE